MRVLIAMDGSPSAIRALRAFMSFSVSRSDLDVILLNVQIPIESGHVKIFLSEDKIDGYYWDNGRKALSEAEFTFKSFGMKFNSYIAVGHPAEVIASYVQKYQCDQVFMGSHGRIGVVGFVLGSVVAEVIKLVDCPVTVVK